MSGKRVFEGKHVVVIERDGWEYVERKKARAAVAVVAVTDDGRIVLTEQYRRPVDARVIDFPAGLVGDEDVRVDAAKTAKKELEEETGYVCSRVERLAGGPSSPGITSETVSFYRAFNLRKTGKGGGVGGESITVHEIPREEVVGWLHQREREGMLVDLKVWGGLYFLGGTQKPPS
jgi:ADP-ribose pyrophosphatase